MWPWDHLAFGYVLYLIVSSRRPWSKPDDLTFITLAIGSQLPDIIDKPLAWSVGVLPSGLSLGHSLLFLVSLTVITAALSNRYGRPELAGSVIVGVSSHLIGDVLFALLTGAPRPYHFLFWPVIPTVTEMNIGLVTTIEEFWRYYLRFLSTPRGSVYLIANLTFHFIAVVTWISNGAPGTIAIRKWAAKRTTDP